jgi:hypothetical protein
MREDNDAQSRFVEFKSSSNAIVAGNSPFVTNLNLS